MITEQADPPEDVTQQLVDMGFSHDQAIYALKANNLSVERAADYLLTHGGHLDTSVPDVTMDDWETKEISSARWPTQSAPYTVPDDAGPQPTTGSKDVVDLTKDDHPSDQYTNSSWSVVPYNRDDSPEDEQLSKAVEESMAMSASFGVAWTDPPPHERQRMAPVIGFKFCPTMPFLPSIITAMYHIPVIRQKVLEAKTDFSDWGSAAGYWNGQTRFSYVVHKRIPIASDDVDNSAMIEVEDETSELPWLWAFQKLFTFMALTKRSYGDVSEIASLLQSENAAQDTHTAAETMTSLFAHLDAALSECSSSQSPSRELQKLLHSMGTKETGVDDVATVEDTTHILLESSIERHDVYSCLDNILLDAGSDNDPFWFQQTANVFLLPVKQAPYQSSNDKKLFQIEPVFYPDRYLFDSRHAAKVELAKIRDAKSHLEEGQRNLEIITKFKGKHNAVKLLESSMEYYKVKAEVAALNSPEAVRYARLQAELSVIVEQLRGKHAEMEGENKKHIAVLSNAFSHTDFKRTAYYLKAVMSYDGLSGPGRHWMYLCSNPASADSSWLHIEDAKVTEVSQQKVIDDARGLHMGAGVYMLLYLKPELATVADSDEAELILPALRHFVDEDNAAFAQELMV